MDHSDWVTLTEPSLPCDEDLGAVNGQKFTAFRKLI